MKIKKFNIEIEPEDAVLYAQLTCFMESVIRHARRDFLLAERNYQNHYAFDLDDAESKYSEIPDEAAEVVMERVLNWELLKMHMRNLTLSETEVIINLYLRDMTQGSCAKRMKITERRVRALKKSAIKKLRKSMEV